MSSFITTETTETVVNVDKPTVLNIPDNNPKAEITRDKSKISSFAVIGSIVSGILSLGSGYMAFTAKDDVNKKETFTFLFLLLSTITLIILVVVVPSQTYQVDKGIDSLIIIMAIISAGLTILYWLYTTFVIKN
jgi:hypothetical protein